MYGDNYEAMFNHTEKVNRKGVGNTPLLHHVNSQSGMNVKTFVDERKKVIL